MSILPQLALCRPGVSSYGLSEMMVLAKRLVPIQKPDYLLVPYSPWLVGRAQSPFAPTYFGSVVTPYFLPVRMNRYGIVR
jgi:hypothetical protein